MKHRRGGRLNVALTQCVAPGNDRNLRATAIDHHPTVMTPLLVHPYDDAFEGLRDAADAFEGKHGRRPRVYLAGVGSVAEQVARKNYASDFFQAGGFEVLAREAKSDAAAAAAAFAISGAKIAVICSTDKQYATTVAELAPKLKTAKARTRGARPAIRRVREARPTVAAGVDLFIYLGCNVIETLSSLLHAEEAQP